jgi:hypothetical protein
MKNSKVLKGYLLLAGLLLSFIGASTLLMPVEMKATGGMDIAGEVGILNDVRASSALLLSMAILAISGVFSQKLTYTSSLVSGILFLALGSGRLISIIADGMPAEGLLGATFIEFLFGIAGIIFFLIYREKK